MIEAVAVWRRIFIIINGLWFDIYSGTKIAHILVEEMINSKFLDVVTGKGDLYYE